MPEPEMSIDATIANAVNARIEAELMRALSGDEVIGRYVSAALQQQVEVASGRGYGKDKVVFLNHTIKTTLQRVTKAAIEKVIAEEAELIEDVVRKEIKRTAGDLAKAFTAALTDTTNRAVRLDIKLVTPGNDW